MKELKGHQIFWIGVLISVYLLGMIHAVNHFLIKDQSCAVAQFAFGTTIIALFVDLINQVDRSDYKGLFWSLYQPLKYFNLFLDKLLK